MRNALRWLCALWIRALVRCLPPSFRAAYGREIVALYRASQGGSAGTAAVLRRFVRELGSLLRLLVREWGTALAAVLHGARRAPWLLDARHVARTLARSRAYAIAVVSTLALGIAGLAALSVVVRITLLRPLPYAAPGQLVRIVENAHGAYSGETTSLPNMVAWQERVHTLEHIAAVSAGGGVNVSLGERTVRVRSAQVSAETFALLGVQPLRGGVLVGDDFKPGGARRVVLSHGFWQQFLGADTTIIGRTLRINGAPVEVAGVMPAGFSFPDGTTALLLPLQITPGLGLASPNGRWARLFQAYGRVRAGGTLQSAARELAVVSADLQREFGPPNEGMRARPLPLADTMMGSSRRLIELLTGAAVIVLLVACSNIVALTAVRAAQRRRELAIRMVHGATRGAALRLFGLELAVLGVVGTSVGAWLAVLLGPAASRLIPNALPHAPLRVPELLASASLLGALTVMFLLLGLLRSPVAAAALSQAVSGGTRTTMNRHQRRWRSLMVAGQIAAAITLLIAAAALVRSFLGVVRTPTGFQPQGIVTMAVNPGFMQPAQLEQFYATLEAQVRVLPGVQGLGMVDGPPLSGGGIGWTYVPEGNGIAGGQEPAATTHLIDDDYPSTIGIPLLAGRLLQAADTFAQAPGVLVSATLARASFGTPAAAVGGRITLGSVSSGNVPMTIVGVLGDVRDGSLRDPPGSLIYQRYAASTPSSRMVLVVRADGNASELAARVQTIVRALNPDVPISSVRALDAIVADAAARERVTAAIAGALGALTLLLAAVGITGLFGQLVMDRQRALAIRLAMGATPARVIGETLGSALLIISAGAALGLGAALALRGVLRPFLVRAAPFDAGAAALTILLLGGIGLLAALIPALRSTRRSPLRALAGD